MSEKWSRNLILKSIFLGAASGIVVWTFLKVLSTGTNLLWETLPGIINSPLYTVIICTIGGLLTGLFRKKAGDYPEEMMVVLGKVKREKFYDYKKIPVLLVAAFLPLVFASSVGPEAALVGIITSLCYWVAAKLRDAKGEALTKKQKTVTYSFAIAMGLTLYVVLNDIFGKAMAGFPSFEVAIPRGKDLLLAIVYILAGCLLAKYYDITHHASHEAAAKMPPVVKETAAGLILGVIAAFVPQMMFSGEAEIHHLMTDYVEYLPWMLLGIALLKVMTTNICIQFGLKGGHFFPLIYAGVALGYAMAMFIYPGNAAEHVVFAAAVVTASMLGANMKKPIPVALILLICFPFRMIFWLLIGAFAGCGVMSMGKGGEAND